MHINTYHEQERFGAWQIAARHSDYTSSRWSRANNADQWCWTGLCFREGIIWWGRTHNWRVQGCHYTATGEIIERHICGSGSNRKFLQCCSFSRRQGLHFLLGKWIKARSSHRTKWLGATSAVGSSWEHTGGSDCRWLLLPSSTGMSTKRHVSFLPLLISWYFKRSAIVLISFLLDMRLPE